jgi:hypothetical protein
MDVPATMQSGLPGKRDDAYRAGMTMAAVMMGIAVPPGRISSCGQPCQAQRPPARLYQIRILHAGADSDRLGASQYGAIIFEATVENIFPFGLRRALEVLSKSHVHKRDSRRPVENARLGRARGEADCRLDRRSRHAHVRIPG